MEGLSSLFFRNGDVENTRQSRGDQRELSLRSSSSRLSCRRSMSTSSDHTKWTGCLSCYFCGMPEIRWGPSPIAATEGPRYGRGPMRDRVKAKASPWRGAGGRDGEDPAQLLVRRPNWGEQIGQRE
jgi:hypothetical protein